MSSSLIPSHRGHIDAPGSPGGGDEAFDMSRRIGVVGTARELQQGAAPFYEAGADDLVRGTAARRPPIRRGHAYRGSVRHWLADVIEDGLPPVARGRIKFSVVSNPEERLHGS
jgi:hypothetical protein